MQEPWKTDKWFSSPWSYLPEVRQKQAFGSNLKIHDVTLRDGELFSVGGFTIRGGRIVAMDILADPARLAGLDLSAVGLSGAG